eukprot:GHUV01020311.1.p1 GENE.GHUV01020311.1~~GHUV01020311.1.p1  ORF type:complete len:106 (-),score=14.02 GHUV01020311.1:648-965(-)
MSSICSWVILVLSPSTHIQTERAFEPVFILVLSPMTHANRAGIQTSNKRGTQLCSAHVSGPHVPVKETLLPTRLHAGIHRQDFKVYGMLQMILVCEEDISATLWS